MSAPTFEPVAYQATIYGVTVMVSAHPGRWDATVMDDSVMDDPGVWLAGRFGDRPPVASRRTRAEAEDAAAQLALQVARWREALEQRDDATEQVRSICQAPMGQEEPGQKVERGDQ